MENFGDFASFRKMITPLSFKSYSGWESLYALLPAFEFTGGGMLVIGGYDFIVGPM